MSLSLVSVVRCQVVASATGRSLPEKSYRVSVCVCVTGCDRAQR